MLAHHGITNIRTRFTTTSFWNSMQKNSWFPCSGSPHGFETTSGSSAICIVGGVDKRQVGLRCCVDSIGKAYAPIWRDEARERSKSSMLGWNSKKNLVHVKKCGELTFTVSSPTSTVSSPALHRGELAVN